MDDLKSVTVEYLRELARKHLGRGHSKLRTKAQLLAALAVVVPALAALAKKVKEKGKKAAGKAKGVAKKAHEATPKVKPAEVFNFPPKPRRVEPPGGAPTPTEPRAQAPQAVQHDAEPVVEGFFVARVRGEDEARLHHLTGQGPHASGGGDAVDERLGELAPEYGDDVALALARDPHSLYVTWDFNAATRRQAMDGLEAPRAVLRVFDGEALVREVDFALESRSYYLHGLAAGRTYRVEAHFVGRDGRSRRIGPATNRVQLPWVGPSPDTTVRFMRMPTRMPFAAGAQAGPIRSVTLEEHEYLTWRRVPLPGSGGFEDVPEVQRERTPSEGPGAPGHLGFTPRPPGASEQRYLEVSREEGSSEQTTWTPPPSGRGRM